MVRRRREKTWSRNYTRTHNRVVRHKKDFEWRPRKSNPYQRSDQEPKNWALRVKVLVLVFIVGLLGWLFLFHPFFQINTISVTGIERLSEDDIIGVAHSVLDQKILSMFPASSYLFVRTKELRDVLLARYPIQDVTITVQFPNDLQIEIKERISTIIYDNGQQYAYIGLDGHIVEIIRQVGESEWDEEIKKTTTTLADGTIRVEEEVISRTHRIPVRDIVVEMGDLPIIYDMRASQKEEGEAILEPMHVEAYVHWFRALRDATDIPISYFELQDTFGNSVLYTTEGWAIYMNLNRSVEQQISALQEVLKEVPRPNFEYIDVRFGERVHWK